MKHSSCLPLPWRQKGTADFPETTVLYNETTWYHVLEERERNRHLKFCCQGEDAMFYTLLTQHQDFSEHFIRNETTRYHTPKDRNLDIHYCGNLILYNT